MKQFLIPESNREYTLAKELKFLLYPFNLDTGTGKVQDNHPFAGIYQESIYGNIDKSGNFIFTMNIVHGPTQEVHEYGGSWGSSKERMSLRECFVVVDSQEEKNSKFVQHYNSMKSDHIFGGVSKDMTYSIFTDFLNNSKNTSYKIPSPKPHVYEPYDSTEFPRVITKSELIDAINFYQNICAKSINNQNEKFNNSSLAYKLRIDKKIDSYIPMEHILAPGTKFKFIKLEQKSLGSNKKFKKFVEIEISNNKIYILQEDFKEIWVD